MCVELCAHRYGVGPMQPGEKPAEVGIFRHSLLHLLTLGIWLCLAHYSNLYVCGTLCAHRYGVGPMQPGEKPAEVGIFRHSLLHHYMCSIFCKVPIQPMTKMAHLQQMFMLRIILSVFQFRVNKRWVKGQYCNNWVLQ